MKVTGSQQWSDILQIVIVILLKEMKMKFQHPIPLLISSLPSLSSAFMDEGTEGRFRM